MEVAVSASRARLEPHACIEHLVTSRPL